MENQEQQQQFVEVPELTVDEAQERLRAALHSAVVAKQAYDSARQVAEFAQNELDIARFILDGALLRESGGAR